VDCLGYLFGIPRYRMVNYYTFQFAATLSMIAIPGLTTSLGLFLFRCQVYRAAGAIIFPEVDLCKNG
jgi:hypothetical protein